MARAVAGTVAVRRMHPDELPIAVGWAADEGWNPGRRDAAVFAASDPDGFLVAVDAGEAVGCIAAVRYDDGSGFLGLHLVRPDRRSEGIGRALWTHALDHHPARPVGLDGVVAQQAYYERCGFTLAHRTLRYGGLAREWRGGSGACGALRIADEVIDLDALVALDALHSQAPRSRYARAWLAQPHARIAVALDGGDSVGMAVARRCRVGWKLAPVFAPSPDVAEVLIGRVARGLGSALVFLDCPEPNTAGLALLERHGMRAEFEVARMYRGRPPALPVERIYGFTSLELG